MVRTINIPFSAPRTTCGFAALKGACADQDQYPRWVAARQYDDTGSPAAIDRSLYFNDRDQAERAERLQAMFRFHEVTD